MVLIHSRSVVEESRTDLMNLKKKINSWNICDVEGTVCLRALSPLLVFDVILR